MILALSSPGALTVPENAPPPPTRPTTLKAPNIFPCKNLGETKQVHALLIKTSQISDTYPAGRLAELYAVSDLGSLEDAESLLESMPHPSPFAVDAVIRGYLKRNRSRQAILLYDRMLRRSVRPDPHTFTSLLTACTLLPDPAVGRQLHSQVLKHGFEDSPFVRNKLIRLYAVFGSVVDARKVFDKSTQLDTVAWNSMLHGYASDGDRESLNRLFYAMPCRDVVSWNTLMSYHVQVAEFEEALFVFRRMQEEGEKPDRVTLISALTAISHLGALAHGKWVHAYISKHKIELDGNLSSSLINMYSKCGCLDGAVKAFEETKAKSVDIWNAMIMGLASNDKSVKVFEMFSMMERSNARPNAITFACILNACSHGGLVEHGFGYFKRMINDYKIDPDIVHYGCMVDLLGRSGLFDKAEEIIRSMPMKPSAVMWKALLSACRVHKNFEMGEKAGLELIKLAPNDDTGYVLLSNIYAMAHKWDQVNEVRETMRGRQIRKLPGSSLVELDGMAHEFVAGDDTHFRKREIYEMLDEMGERLKLVGYEPDTEQVLHDTDAEVKQTSLGHHSEKLAVAFCFISTSPGTPVRVIKNLRMCNDCHSAMKFLSMIYGRVIIIRDSNRYHHFRNGTCSCMDFW